MANVNEKSLFEQVKEVMDSAMSYTAKRRTLLKIRGLRPGDVDNILAVERMKARADFDISKLTFGIEIETVGAHYRTILDRAAEKGVDMQYMGYTHATTPHYKLVTDASLSGHAYSIECVTPVLKGAAGRSSLKKCCETLSAAGAFVNRSCGLHVHVGATEISDEHYIRVFKNYQRLEDAIDTFMAASRRGSMHWCRSIKGFDFNRCRTKDNVLGLMRDRYFKVNPMAYHAHGTIEFRQHAGTISYEKMTKWVNFLFKLIQWSYSHELDHDVTTIAEIPFLNATEKAYFESRSNSLNRGHAAA